MGMNFDNITVVNIDKRHDDDAPVKRVELNCRTKMSGGMASADELIAQAAKWGHKAIAITDLNVAQAFPAACEAGKEHGVKVIYGLTVRMTTAGEAEPDGDYVTLLARNQTGLKNLYRILTLTLTEYMREDCLGPVAAIPRNVLSGHREGLLVGAANASGADRIDGFYDYIEIAHADPSIAEAELAERNRALAVRGEELGIPVAAAGCVRFLDDAGEAAAKLLDGGCKSPFEPGPCFHFLTTGEMLARFAYLGREKAYEAVVTNTNLIADMAGDDILPVPDGFFMPELTGADDEIAETCHARAREIYGGSLPAAVRERLDYELDSILPNGYAGIYMIARKLVAKSNEAGYPVGARGSVGASLVAYLLGITDIDPLKHNIPFETFAGIDGTKMPDIDLNYSNEFQAESQKHVMELFGKDRVFQAGTVSAVSDMTATDIVCERTAEAGIALDRFDAEVLAARLAGRRRCTGQYPGALFILPADKDIHDFTPVQYTGNGKNHGILTTHFDYCHLEGHLLKVDILGYDTLTKIKKAEDLTGIPANTIRFDDAKTLDLLINTDARGVPEFDTRFVRDGIHIAKPKTFDDLVKISVLSHGGGVWDDNAENLLKDGTAALSEVIATRDDIMVYLMGKGLSRETAFAVMEDVRKGKGLTGKHREMMLECGVPEWYVESCGKIRYMFPKAHAVAYTMMAFRIAWYMAHYPEVFRNEDRNSSAV